MLVQHSMHEPSQALRMQQAQGTRVNCTDTRGLIAQTHIDRVYLVLPSLCCACSSVLRFAALHHPLEPSYAGNPPNRPTNQLAKPPAHGQPGAATAPAAAAAGRRGGRAGGNNNGAGEAGRSFAVLTHRHCAQQASCSLLCSWGCMQHLFKRPGSAHSNRCRT